MSTYPPLFSPHLGDKLVDWALLARAGGQTLVVDKDILELGPSYGIDLMMWAPYARSYTMIESAPNVIDHLQPMVDLLRARACAVSLITANLQHGDPSHVLMPGQQTPTADLVIDFGTVDNVLDGLHPFAMAYRALRPGGMLLTTYANRGYFEEEYSPSGDELRFTPQALANFFRHELGALTVVRMGEDQPRAGMAVQRPL